MFVPRFVAAAATTLGTNNATVQLTPRGNVTRFSKVLVSHSRGVACPTPPAPVSGHGALFAFSRALPHSAFLHRLFRWTASPLFTRAGIYGPHKSCPPGHAVEEKGLLGMISGQTEGWKVERGEGRGIHN